MKEKKYIEKVSNIFTLANKINMNAQSNSVIVPVVAPEVDVNLGTDFLRQQNVLPIVLGFLDRLSLTLTPMVCKEWGKAVDKDFWKDLLATENMCKSALKKKRYPLLRWLREQGCPWGDLTVTFAIECGCDEKVIEWLKSEGCPLKFDNVVCPYCKDILEGTPTVVCGICSEDKHDIFCEKCVDRCCSCNAVSCHGCSAFATCDGCYEPYCDSCVDDDEDVGLCVKCMEKREHFFENEEEYENRREGEEDGEGSEGEEEGSESENSEDY